MLSKRFIKFSLLVWGVLAVPLNGQVYKTISSPANLFTAIDSIYSFDSNNVDSLVVDNTSGFGAGDTVMVYCVQGAKIEEDDQEEAGRDARLPRNTGRYAFVLVDRVEPARDLVILNTTLQPDIKPLGEGEVAQLIRVPSYRHARIPPSGISAPDWDGSTGGVVALFVSNVLKMEGAIDVRGKGFRGRPYMADILFDPAECSSVDTALYDSMFYQTANVRAGLKGEGTTDTRFGRLRGRASNINGGGGGNGLLSGGGGGSNYTSGGKGGNEASSCGPGVDLPGGDGGFDLGRPGDAYYDNIDPDRTNRIFLGGGGGSGTWINGRTSTRGGDGGGIVVIVADTIEGNGNWIYADGENVATVATGAAGGGGGGGAILLDVSGYRTTLNLSAVGGDGGDTNHPSDTTGPGGGGGGGIYWLSGTLQPGVNPEVIDRGQNGEYVIGAGNAFGANIGGRPGKLNGLESNIMGFVFNPVPVEFTVCSDQLPEPIRASEPKGGAGPGSYSYLWVDSSATQNEWLPAPGVNNQKDYTFPASLDDTTYYRRVVTSGLLPPDTSFRIAVYVHPAITGNTVSAPDTVCRGNQPELFVNAGTIGGGPTGGTYEFRWHKDEGSGFTPADGPGNTTGPDYQAPGLEATTVFARVAYSGVCVDTSNQLRVQVWEPLTNNTISPNDTICFNTAPDLIQGPVPGQGDPSDKRYQWQSAPASGGTWTPIGSETSTSYQPPALTETVWYRRIAFSGSDDACIDTSQPVEILNIPLVTGNTIGTTQTVCTGDRPDPLTGSDPGGGYQSQYGYTWQSRTLSTGWSEATGENSVKTAYDPGIMQGDTTWYRRVVGSGGVARNVCLNYSDSIAVNVLPSITGNLITTSDLVKCQDDLLEDLVQDPAAGPEPGGGATQGGTDPTRLYQWQVATGTDTPGTWQSIAGGAGLDYTARPQLTGELDRFYRRIVFSGPGQACRDTSQILHVVVHSGITGNTILPFDSVCFSDGRVLEGDTPAGEPGFTTVFTWRNLQTGQNLPGSDTEDFTAGPFNQLGDYPFERVAEIGECTDTSNIMQVTVMQLPGGRLTDPAFRACEQDTALEIDLNLEELTVYSTPFEVVLSNETEPAIGPFSITQDGTVPVTLDIDSDSMLLNYRISSVTYRAIDNKYECSAPQDSLSGTVPVWIFRRPSPEILVDGEARDSFKVCNTTIELTADPDNGTAMWISEPSGNLFFSQSDGPDEYLASIPNNREAFGEYRATFISEAGDCAGEDHIDLHYFEQPDNAFAGNDTMVFLQSTLQLKAEPASAGTGTWELIQGNGIIADPNDPNSLVYELGMDEENQFRWTVTNGEDEGTCTTSQDVVIVIRTEVKRYSGFSPDGDEFNRYFIMQGLKYADEFTFTVFNSLGVEVFTANQDDIDEKLEVDPSLISNGLKEDEMVVWDGMATNGNLVPSGTYYYVVNYILKQRDPQGNVTREDSYERKDYVVVKHD